VLAHADVDVEVTGRRAGRTALALPRQADAVAVVDAGRHLHLQPLGALHAPLAVAVGARAADHLAAPAAVGAALLHGEDAALEPDLAAAATGAAGLELAVRGAAAVAGGALLQGRDLDRAGDAAHRLLEVELPHGADVGAAPGAARPSAAAEDVPEDVAEDVVHVGEAGPAGTAAHAVLEGGVAVLVVHPAPFGIGEDLVRFLALLERGFRGGVARVAVRVVLHRAAAIGLLEFIGPGAA